MTKRTTIRLVPPLQEELSELAEEMGVSYNQLVNYALARFVESQKGISRLEERARRSSKTAFLRVLDELDRERGKGTAKPQKDDELPRGYRRKAFLARLEQQKRGGSADR